MTNKIKVIEDFNIFVGGKTGAFKGIKCDSKGILVKNLQNIEILKPEDEISILNWSDNNESDIMIGTVNQIVRIYDTEFKAYSNSFEAKIGNGPLVGLTRFNGAITTCSKSGHIKLWKYGKNKSLEIETGSDVSKMQKYHQKEGIVGLGGKDNDLKLWDLERKVKIFTAKNVKKDMLQLEIPVWVTDLTFLPDYEYKVIVSTKYGQVRLYDTKAQRRPVINIDIQSKSINTLSLCYNKNQVVIGSATGHIMLVDIRGKGKIVQAYKGAVGSIRQVACHPDLPYVGSVGLDRYLRIHHLETKHQLHQHYLKVRLNCILMKSSFGKEDYDSNQEVNEEKSVELVDLESDQEYDEMFENMENVISTNYEPCSKRKRKH